MYIRFLDEDDKIVIWALVALITMPIWGSIILLIRGVANAYAWVLEHQTIIYSVLFSIIAMTSIITSFVAWRNLNKSKVATLPHKLYFTLIPFLGTAGASFCFYKFIDIANNASTSHTGVLLLFHFLVWLIGSLIGFFVVVVGQIVATCAATSYFKTYKNRRKESYWIALIPCGAIVAYWLLNVIF